MILKLKKGQTNSGSFKKGTKTPKPFKKGHVPWNKEKNKILEFAHGYSDIT